MKKTLLTLLVLSSSFGLELSAQTVTSGRTTVYQHTHQKTTELKHTLLRVSFDYEKEQMNGEATLTASPYFYPSDSLVLNAKAMLIHEVALQSGNSKTPLKYDYKNDILNINLGKTYQKAEPYTVYIKYTARPNEVTGEGSQAISDAKGLYFINPKGDDPNKPTQIWTQGETESSSVWFPTIDKPNMKTTQEIYMTVPDKYVTLSNGELKSSVKKEGGLRTDHWVMDKPHAPYLFFMGVGDYAVVKDKWRNIPVDYYVEKEYEPYAKGIFGYTPEMIEHFSKLLNYDYPWNKYSQMTARDYVSGAMENTTAVLFMEDAQQTDSQLIDHNEWEETIAHELFHHWFGDLVTTESWSNLSMNESFANYSQYLWNEYKYGKDIADYGLKKEIDGYLMDPSNINKDLIRFNYHSREDMFDAVSYNKGGAVLHMLRNYLGDKAFFQGLNLYLKTNEYSTAEAHQLRLALEKVSGKDLNWFFNQWFYGSGHPKLSYTTSFEPVKKEVTLSLNQNQAAGYFEFPIAIDVRVGGKTMRHQVWAEAKAKNSFTFPASSAPELVIVNSDGVLLSEISESKTPAQYLLQYTTSKDYLSRFKAVENAKSSSSDVNSLKTLVAALSDENYRVRMQALGALDLSKADQQKAALSKVEALAQNDPKTLVKAAAIRALDATKNSKYLPLFEKGTSELSNAIKGSSLSALYNLSPEKAKEKANAMELKGLPSDVIEKLIPIIVEGKMEKHRAEIASTVAFYPFIRFQNPELAPWAEKGFQWIMSSDDYRATENITRIYTQAHGQIGNNPQAKMLIIQALQEAQTLKLKALRENSSSKSLNAQVDLINRSLKLYQ